jgi:hypothetical protein
MAQVRAGEALLIDNYRMLHGRDPFVGGRLMWRGPPGPRHHRPLHAPRGAFLTTAHRVGSRGSRSLCGGSWRPNTARGWGAVMCWTDARMYEKLADVCICGCGQVTRRAILALQKNGDNVSIAPSPHDHDHDPRPGVRRQRPRGARRDGGHYALPALPGGPWHPERGCGGSHNEWVRMETVGPMLA